MRTSLRVRGDCTTRRGTDKGITRLLFLALTPGTRQSESATDYSTARYCAVEINRLFLDDRPVLNGHVLPLFLRLDGRYSN